MLCNVVEKLFLINLLSPDVHGGMKEALSPRELLVTGWFLCFSSVDPKDDECENPSRSGVSEMLKPAPTTMQRSKTPFFLPQRRQHLNLEQLDLHVSSPTPGIFRTCQPGLNFLLLDFLLFIDLFYFYFFKCA